MPRHRFREVDEAIRGSSCGLVKHIVPLYAALGHRQRRPRPVYGEISKSRSLPVSAVALADRRRQEPCPMRVQVADRWHLTENASRVFLNAVRKSARLPYDARQSQASSHGRKPSIRRLSSGRTELRRNHGARKGQSHAFTVDRMRLSPEQPQATFESLRQACSSAWHSAISRPRCSSVLRVWIGCTPKRPL